MSKAPDGHGIDSTIQWLVAREIVAERAILDGDLVVEALPGRNRNLLLTISDGPDLLVKLADELASESGRTLRAEGNFFRDHVLPGSELCARVPKLVHYDPSEPVLVFELLSDHVTLADRLAMAPAPEFPIHVWREVSWHLAHIHNELRLAGPAPSGALPWVVRAEQPSLAALAMLSPAGLRVLEIIQGSSVIGAGLRGVGDVWNCVAVTHGDIRPQNILLSAGARSEEDIRFVDWEMQGVGDPAWDLAGLTAALIAACLSRSVEHDPAPGASFPSWATFQASCRALWQGYADGAAQSPPDPRTLTILAAARLIQIAIELTAGISELPAVAVLLLQVSENMFADPARAATELLAIG